MESEGAPRSGGGIQFFYLEGPVPGLRGGPASWVPRPWHLKGPRSWGTPYLASEGGPALWGPRTAIRLFLLSFIFDCFYDL